MPLTWIRYRTSYTKTSHMSSGNSLSSFSRFGRRILYQRNGVWLMVFRNLRKCSQTFSPNIPPKCKGENIFLVILLTVWQIFWWAIIIGIHLSIRLDTCLPRESGTFTNYMELNTLSQKRQNRTTCNLGWSCQCMRFSSAPLNQDGPRLFQLPLQGWRNRNEILQFSLHEIYR